MSSRVYEDGTLIESWDDTTRTYTDHRTEESRPYTAEENAAADQRASDATRVANEAALRAGLDAVLTRATERQAVLRAVKSATNATINASPASYVKTVADATRQTSGDIIRIARLVGGLTDSTSTGDDN